MVCPVSRPIVPSGSMLFERIKKVDMSVTVQFRAKRVVAVEGADCVALVEPQSHHVTADRMVTGRAVSFGWSALFGPNGRVPADHPMVESFGDGFMPTVVVRVPDIRAATRFKRKEFPALVDAYRAEGFGLIESENRADADMVAVLMGRG